MLIGRRRSALGIAALVAVLWSGTQPAFADQQPTWAHGVTVTTATCGLDAVASAVDPANGAVYSAFHQFECGPNGPLLVGYTRSGTQKWTYADLSHDDIPVAVVADPSTHRVMLASTRNGDELLVQAFDGTSGHVVWARGYTASGSANFAMAGMVIGHNGQVIATGTVTRSGVPEISVASFKISDGSTRWHVHFDNNGDSGGATAYAIAADPAVDRAYILASTSSGSGENPMTIAYDTVDGTVAWNKGVRTISAIPTAIVTDTSNHQIYSVVSNRNTAEADVYEYAKGGAAQWTAKYDVDGFEPYVAAGDSSNHQLYIAGVAGSAFDTAVVAFSSTGTRRWADTDTAAGQARPGGLAADKTNHRVYVTSVAGATTQTSQGITFADSASGARAWRSVYAPTGHIALPGSLAVDAAGGQVSIALYQDKPFGGETKAVTVAYPA